MKNIKESGKSSWGKIKKSDKINNVAYSFKKSGKSNWKKFIKPWKRLRHWLNETWIILAIFGLIIFAIYKMWLKKPIYSIHISDEWVTYMFSTGTGNNNHFQWVGISTVLAVVAFIFNAIWNKKNFNADIKSKSRIDWMKTVRNNYSEFLAISKEIFEILNSKKSQKLSEPEKVRFNTLSMELLSIHNKLILYVPEKSNELIMGAVNDVFVYISKMISKYNNNDSTEVYKTDRSYMNDYIDENYKDIFVMNKIAFEKQKIEEDRESIKTFYNISDDTNFKDCNFTSFLMLCTKMGENYFKNEWDLSKKGK